MLELGDVVVYATLPNLVWSTVLALRYWGKFSSRFALLEWKVNYLMRLREKELGLEPKRKDC